MYQLNCLVKAAQGQGQPQFPEFIATQALELVRRQPSGMITMLTGVSRTADIEKVLVLGAQGPKELEFVLYQEED